MAEFLYEYGLFLLKAITIVIAIVAVIIAIVAAGSRGKKETEGKIEVKKLNEELDTYKATVRRAVLEDTVIKQLHKRDKADKKTEQKALKKALKAHKENPEEALDEKKKRVFIIDFLGDIKASAIKNLRREITALLTVADTSDEVVIRLESPGGMVHSYGLAASQLMRIKDKGIPLTVCVDKVAASGGYLMACIADKIVAAPFAVLGSIGVVAQVPNIHRLLKKNDVDVEVLTAGEYKRTLTILGENTEKSRKKFIEELEDTHELFKKFVGENRPQLALNEVATGEHWYGRRAIEKKLVDLLQSSDEYIVNCCEQADVYALKYVHPEPLAKKLGLALPHALEQVAQRFWEKTAQSRYHL
ncbi:MAG: protease SohB [Gammaproteobacteria bacterium]|nr:protease SohB [Gammaproteobacteria bacterium]